MHKAPEYVADWNVLNVRSPKGVSRRGGAVGDTQVKLAENCVALAFDGRRRHRCGT